MKNFMVLTMSIKYIEDNLCRSITRQDIADHCFVSLSYLEKIFKYALHYGIKDYISKRRMTQAAKDILENNMSITEVAMKYQYNSVEVFSRLFRRVWNVNPSEFKNNWKFTGLFPKLNYEYIKGDNIDMAYKKVDISEAYDFLKAAKGSYVLCFDGVNFSGYNEISYKAGDAAIVEIASRIDKYATNDMITLRIGGDEFALITQIYNEEQARELADKVLLENGNTFNYEGQNLPLSLWCGITKLPEELRYSELFYSMHNTILESKK